MAQTNVNTHGTSVSDMLKLFADVAAKFGSATAQAGAVGTFALAFNGGDATFTRGGQAVLTLTNVGAHPTWAELNLGVMHALTIVTAAAENRGTNKAAAVAVAAKYKYD